MADTTYTAKDITVLEGLEPVRLRPGMYIGSTGSRGLHHLIFEVVDNSVDEALAGRNDRVEITLHPDNSVTVRDWGSGIPVDVMPEQGLPGAHRRADEAPCRRQVRRRRLQGLRRPPRRRHLRRQRALRVVHRRRLPRRQDLPAGVRARRPDDRDGDRRRRARGRDRHHDPVPPRPRDLRRARVVDADPAPAPPRDGFPHAELPHRARGRAHRRGAHGVLLRGRDQGLRRLRERGEGRRPPAHHLPRGRDRSGRGRDRDAVEQLVRGVGLLVREQHQHHRGRLAPLGLQGGAHRHAQQVRARQGAPEGEGGQPRGRGRARGPRRRDLGQAARAAVRGADQDEARQPGRPRPRRAGRQRAARGVPRGEPGRRAPDHHKGRLRVARPPGRPQGARAHAAQERARELVAAGQARRLLEPRPRLGRALHRRGRLRRRLGQAGARPQLPGDPPAAREDHQQREEPDQQGALEQRDPGDDHRDRHRLRRRVRHREPPLQPRDRDDRRRRRRLAHPHADPHLPLPPAAASSSSAATSTSRCRRSTT